MAYVPLATRIPSTAFESSYRLSHCLPCRLGRPVARQPFRQNIRTFQHAQSRDPFGRNTDASQRLENDTLPYHVALRNERRRAGDEKLLPDKVELRRLKKQKRVYEDSLKFFYKDLLNLSRKVPRALPRAQLVSKARAFQKWRLRDEDGRSRNRPMPLVLFHAVDLTEGKPEWVELLCANILKNQREPFLFFVQAKYPALKDWIIENKRAMRHGKIRVPNLPKSQDPWHTSVALKLKLIQGEQKEPVEQADPKRIYYLEDEVIRLVVQHKEIAHRLDEYASAIAMSPDSQRRNVEEKFQQSDYNKDSPQNTGTLPRAGIVASEMASKLASELPSGSSSGKSGDHASPDPFSSRSPNEATSVVHSEASPSLLDHAQALTVANDFFQKHSVCQLWVGTQWRSRPFHGAYGIVSEVALLSRSCQGKSALLNAIFGAQKATAHIRKEMIKTMRAWGIRATEDISDGLDKSNNGNENSAVAEVQGGDRNLKLGILNMPAYGYEGQGATPYEIVEYLSIRQGLKVAFVLIDASQGVESCDLQILELLKQYGISARPVILRADRSRNELSPIMDPGKEEMMKSLDKLLKDYSPTSNTIQTQNDASTDEKPTALLISPATEEWESLDKGDATGIDEMRLAIIDATGILQPPNLHTEADDPIIDLPFTEPPPKAPRPIVPKPTESQRKQKDQDDEEEITKVRGPHEKDPRPNRWFGRGNVKRRLGKQDKVAGTQ